MAVAVVVGDVVLKVIVQDLHVEDEVAVAVATKEDVVATKEDVAATRVAVAAVVAADGVVMVVTVVDLAAQSLVRWLPLRPNSQAFPSTP